MVGNAYPALFGKLVHGAIQGNFNEALHAHRKLSRVYKLMTVDGNPSGIKALLAVQQRIANVLRLPLVPARPDTCQALAALNRELEQY